MPKRHNEEVLRAPPRGPHTRFERALKDAKIERFHWHDLRHTAARRLRLKGAKLEYIVEFLGHKTLATTKRYAHLRLTALQDVVARLEENPTVRKGTFTGSRTGPGLSGEAAIDPQVKVN